MHHTQYCSDIKRDEIMPFPVRRKKLEVIIVSEVSETGTGRLYRISLLVKSTKKMDANKLHCKRQTNSQT